MPFNASETTCAACGQQFEPTDLLTLQPLETSDRRSLLVPVHFVCSLVQLPDAPEAVALALASLTDAVGDLDVIQGPPGDPGQPGPAGEPGAVGRAGAQGRTGLTGESGRPGVSPTVAEVMPELVRRLKSDADFLSNIKGEQGDAGPEGKDGQPGSPGPAGKDAASPDVNYIVDQLISFLKIDPDFVASVQGAQGPAGKDGRDGRVGEKGDSGPPGPAGQDGRSPTASEVATTLRLNQGFLDSIKGDQGPTGQTGPQGRAGSSPSAEDVATVLLASDQFIASVKGDPGEQGEPGDPGPQGKDGPPGRLPEGWESMVTSLAERVLAVGMERVRACEAMIRNPVVFRPTFHDEGIRAPGTLVGIVFCPNPDCGRPYDMRTQLRLPDRAVTATFRCEDCRTEVEVTATSVDARG